MDRPLEPDSLSLLQSTRTPNAPPEPRVPSTSSRDEVVVRKSQKADREKLRRDRLNEHFIELGNTLDPDRPKNDKATILSDAMQLLKDLTAQVNQLKAEYSTLCEESRELMQEKNDLREEKASLKSDIESLNAQYQQRARAMFPWPVMDHSMVMAPPSYPYPVPIAVPSGPIPVHPPMQPYPFYATPNPSVIPNSHSTLLPFATPNLQVEQLSGHYAPALMQLGNQSLVSSNKNDKSKERKHEKSGSSNDVTTDLELKTPGSATDNDSSSPRRSSMKSTRKDGNTAERSSSSHCSSPRSVQDSSSSSIVGCSNSKANG
ncbi:transcription factor bHLH121-like isoform X1 [Rhodamnia argentea]|uniref:Transcription factor bHLH121-like isoform X1 n=1 Tax=Rhodamnia argentea TaxID=178133 RepID=A0A8B8PD68_9MYRT|nr:transcription factor bHLH121-like isoform X1 [Rhodamnia argentea]XP_030531973.1 transcription factor bHLH121-like isoform X1 [Rhodamnia argentea]XP_030531974.1 transcription factor bHLH121-like isoform X1 [Rhodamnia argentea]